MSAYEGIQVPNVHWEVRREWRERLFASGTPSWFDLEKDDRAQCVKIGDGRSTWKVRIGDDLHVYVKLFGRSESFFDILKILLGRSAPQRERRSADSAFERAVPAAKCLAYGKEQGTNGREILILEAIPDSRTLTEKWADEDTPGGANLSTKRTRNRLLQCVAESFATAHEGGFAHDDAHPDNILIRPGANGFPEATFIDLPCAGLTWGPLSVARGARDIAQLNQWGRRHASATERMRFLRYYLRRRGHLSPEFVGREGEQLLARIVNREGILNASRLARIRDRRLRRNGKYFVCLQFPGRWTARVVPQLERRDVFPEIGVPDRTIDDWRSLLTDSFLNSNESALPGLGRVHRRQVDDFVSKLNWTLFGSSLRRAFMRAHQLRHRDLNAPLFLGYAEHRNEQRLIDRAILVSPANDHASSG